MFAASRVPQAGARVERLATLGSRHCGVAAARLPCFCAFMTRAFRLQAAALVATGTLAAVASAFGASPAPDTPSPASSSSAPTLDHSASVPQQLVWLRSGAVVRGQLVEFVPGERVVLQLATGEVRTVMWDEVERASWIDAPPAASTLSAAPAAASSVPAPPAASAGVVLHIVSDRPGLWLETRQAFKAARTGSACAQLRATRRCECRGSRCASTARASPSPDPFESTLTAAMKHSRCRRGPTRGPQSDEERSLLG